VRYPVEAQKRGIEGRVLVQFVVDKDGKVTDAKIVKNANYYLDIEALRVVNAMPAWIPGKLEGKTVRVYYTLPVNFRLQ
jgi:protein TonB